MATKGEYFTHHKRKGQYQVLGLASLQNANRAPLEEGASIVVYQEADGSWWAREQSEFEDGRFKQVDTPRPDPEQKYAVCFGGTWSVVNAVSSLAYSENKDYPVWSEVGSTAWVGKVGEEDQRVQLTFPEPAREEADEE